MITLSGKVIHGQKYGGKIGFPTANLDRRNYSKKKLSIKLGVYAGQAELVLPGGHQKFKAGIVIGPIDRKGLPKIEAHLIGFGGNIYGKKIILQLIKFLRPFKKFKTEELLKQQIAKDLKKIN